MSPVYRLAVMADIHGNLPGFEAVMADLEQYAPLDGYLVAGDVVGGPGQEAILQRLIATGAVVAHGNGEVNALEVADGAAPDYIYTARQFTFIRWVVEHLSLQSLAFLRSQPAQSVVTLPGALPVRVVHGSPRDVVEGVNPLRRPELLAEVMRLVPEPVVVFGHTHWPFQVRLDGRLAFNPGAVYFPEDGFIGSEYALLDWDGERWTAQHHQVAYDLAEFRRSYRDSGFLAVSPLCRIYLEDAHSGIDTLHTFFDHCQTLAEAAGCADLPYFPDEIWQQAEETFPWDGVLI
jgi:predicted phosphodiesterase